MADERSAPRTQPPGSDWRILARRGEQRIELANQGVFDELVVDQWLHLEQLDERSWWLRIGDVRLVAVVADDGSVTVDVQRGVYDQTRGQTTIESDDVPA